MVANIKGENWLRIFEGRVLRRIFGPRKDEVTGERRKVPNEEFNNLYCPPNIVHVIKSRRLKRAGHVAYMGQSCIQNFVGNSKGKT